MPRLLGALKFSWLGCFTRSCIVRCCSCCRIVLLVPHRSDKCSFASPRMPWYPWAPLNYLFGSLRCPWSHSAARSWLGWVCLPLLEKPKYWWDWWGIKFRKFFLSRYWGQQRQWDSKFRGGRRRCCFYKSRRTGSNLPYKLSFWSDLSALFCRFERSYQHRTFCYERLSWRNSRIHAATFRR